jgi:hypothetical protein
VSRKAAEGGLGAEALGRQPPSPNGARAGVLLGREGGSADGAQSAPRELGAPCQGGAFKRGMHQEASGAVGRRAAGGQAGCRQGPGGRTAAARAGANGAGGRAAQGACQGTRGGGCKPKPGAASESRVRALPRPRPRGAKAAACTHSQEGPAASGHLTIGKQRAGCWFEAGQRCETGGRGKWKPPPLQTRSLAHTRWEGKRQRRAYPPPPLATHNTKARGRRPARRREAPAGEWWGRVAGEAGGRVEGAEAIVNDGSARAHAFGGPRGACARRGRAARRRHLRAQGSASKAARLGRGGAACGGAGSTGQGAAGPQGATFSRVRARAGWGGAARDGEPEGGGGAGGARPGHGGGGVAFPSCRRHHQAGGFQSTYCRAAQGPGRQGVRRGQGRTSAPSLGSRPLL